MVDWKGLRKRHEYRRLPSRRQWPQLFSLERGGIQPFILNFQGKEETLSSLDKDLIRQVSEIIQEASSADDLGSFSEDEEYLCIQSWLTDFMAQQNRGKVLIYEFCLDFFPAETVKASTRKLLSLFETCHNESTAFRPTRLIRDESSEIYRGAEVLESHFSRLELIIALTIANLAPEYDIDISGLYEEWDDNGWEDEIAALKDYINK